MRRRVCVFHNSNRQKDVNVDRGLHICPTRTRSQKDLNMALNVHSNVALCVWKTWNAKNNLSKRTLPDLSILRFGRHASMVWWWNGGVTTHNTLFPHTILAPNVCDRSHHGRDCMSTSHTWWVYNIMTQARTKTQDWVKLDKIYKSVQNLQHADELEKNADGQKAHQVNHDF